MQSVPFSDFGIRWFEDIVEKITEWFTHELETGYENLAQGTFSTPLPDGEGTSRIFSQPPESDEMWHAIYEATVAGEMMIFGLVLLFICVQGRHFIRIFDFGSAYEHRKAKRSSWTGAFLIVGWYWIAVVTLYIVEGITIGLIPDINEISGTLVSMLPDALTTPIMTLILAGIGAISVLILRALFFLREVLLYVFVYVMPIGLAIGFGNIPVASPIAKRLCAQFIPLALLPIPAALLFRGYELLFTGPTTLPVSGSFFEYLVVISLPLLALLVTWKTFKYASPLAARAIGATGRGAILLGSVAGAAYLAGPKAAAMAGAWGPKAAAGATLANRYRSQPTTGDSSQSETAPNSVGGRPEYRRKENDPAYY